MLCFFAGCMNESMYSVINTQILNNESDRVYKFTGSHVHKLVSPDPQLQIPGSSTFQLINQSTYHSCSQA